MATAMDEITASGDDAEVSWLGIFLKKKFFT